MVAPLAALLACQAVPPPPLVPLHASTEPAARGSTAAMIVVGSAGQLLGGGGLGVAVRLEHQAADRTAIGVELAGGVPRGVEAELLDRPPWFAALRGYGRSSGPDWAAATWGAGLSVVGTGLVTLGVHGGGALAAVNDYAVPTLQLSFALATPLARGRPFGERRAVPSTQLWIVGDVGLLVPIGDTGNQASVDLGLARTLGAEDANVMGALSIADGQRF